MKEEELDKFLLLHIDYDITDDKLILIFETNYCKVLIETGPLDREHAERMLVRFFKNMNRNDVERALAPFIGILFEGRPIEPIEEIMIKKWL